MSLFYVGATFTRYKEARSLIDKIVSMGHECVEDWTRCVEDFGSDGEMLASSGDGYQQAEHWEAAAEREVQAVARVSMDHGFCVFLGQTPSLGWPVELGMSIAFGVPYIFVVEPFKTTVFMALEQVHECVSTEHALDLIRSLGVDV
jgi:hypothetical protein